MVSDVAVAAVTIPMAPLLKTTRLLAATVEKPNPVIVIVVAVIARLAVLTVTTGMTFATLTAAPLEKPFVVTTTVRLPAVVGFVENVTVSVVAVAAVTVPMAPLSKVTVFSAATVLKPAPVIVIEDALAANDVVAAVTAGATVAI